MLLCYYATMSAAWIGGSVAPALAAGLGVGPNPAGVGVEEVNPSRVGWSVAPEFFVALGWALRTQRLSA